MTNNFHFLQTAAKYEDVIIKEYENFIHRGDSA